MKTKKLLFVILALIMFKANAQPPTAAPIPSTHAAADVISVFSGVYTNQSGTDFNPNWGQGTLVSDYIVSGDTMKKYANLDYQGTDFGSNKINASSMSNLHVDIWTDNCATFDFYLVNNTIAFEQKVVLTPTFSGWNSYDIPLSSFASTIVSNIGQFKYVGIPQQNHSSTKVVYLDNIYFWKPANVPTITGFSISTKVIGDAPFLLTAPSSTSSGAFTYTSSNLSVATVSNDTVTVVGVGSTTITANQAADGGFSAGMTSATLTVSYPPPATAATTPTHLQANVISVYSDAYTNISGTNFRPDWGQSTSLTNLTISGNSTIKYDNLNYEGIEFVSDQNVSSMENVHFDIWTPNCTSLDFYLIKITGGTVQKKVTLNPTLSGWNSFDIPFSSFSGLDFTKIRQFKLEGTTGSTIYLDNIYFWRSASSPVITGFSVPAKNLGDAAFNLTAPSSNSNGAFTYTSSNPNVATISGSTVTIVGIGSTTITASQAADAPYTAGSTSAILVVTYPPPPTAAPVPTKDAADVLSVFSDTYTNINGTDFYPNWGQSTVVSNISIGGNTTKSYQSLNYQGVQFAGSVDASQMTELHLDIWTPNCTAFDVFLINGVNMEQSVRLNPTLSGWNSFDISLSQYTTINKASIIQLKLVGTPSGSSQVFLDNIYFWKATPVTLGTFTVPAKQVGDAAFALTAPSSVSSGAFTYTSSNTGVATISGNMVTIVGAGNTTITATQAANGNYGSASTTASLVVTLPPLPPAPITAAATPTKPQANVISLFSNAYTNRTVDTWSAGWDAADIMDTTVEGNNTKKYSNLNFSGVEFTSSTINVTNAEYFHIDIWTPNTSVFKIKLVDFGANGVYGGDDVEHELTFNAPTLGSWTSYDIPMSAFTGLVTKGHLAQMIVVSSNSTVYFDNVYFWANSCLNQVTDPSVSIATATTNVCSSSAVMFTTTPTNEGTAPMYQWKKNGSNAGSGSTITFIPNSIANGDVISCVVTRTDGCANDGTSNSITMTLKSSPAIGTSNGFAMCSIGTTKNINNSNTSGGGVWSSSDMAVARVSTVNGASGIVTSTGVGSAILTYSKTGSNGCASTATATVMVSTPTAPNAITGINSICKGSTTQLSSTTTGGVWSTSTNSISSVNSTGLVTGSSAGNAIIKYTVTNAGCSASVNYTVAINAIPNVPSIGYAAGTTNPQIGAGGAFCTNRTFTVVGSPVGGVWSKTGVLSVTTPGGVVNTGLVPGAGSLTYTFTNANGCTNSRTISNNIVACAARGLSEANYGQLTMDNAQFTIFPNPARSFIRLNVETLVGKGQIVVTDLFGKTVKTQTLSMGNNNVDIANLSKGFYLVSVITANGKNTQKLVVE